LEESAATLVTCGHPGDRGPTCRKFLSYDGTEAWSKIGREPGMGPSEEHRERR